MANAVNSIKNLLSNNKLANTHFASPTQNHIIMDTTYQEFEDNQEETLLKSLNTEIGDTLILIIIFYLE